MLIVYRESNRKLRKNKRFCEYPRCNSTFRDINKQKYCPEYSKQNLKKKEFQANKNPKLDGHAAAINLLLFLDLVQK